MMNHQVTMMLKEKEREQNEMNQEKELYRQYLLEQQRQEQNQNREQEVNSNQISENQNQQYRDINNIREDKIPKEEINNMENKPINSFEEYYRQKNNNIQEAQLQMNNNNQPKEQIEDKYDNNEKYPPYSQYPPENLQNPNMYPPQSQEPMSEEQAYMMYQQQQKRRELEQIEMEKEKARQIIERQQREKFNQEQIPNQDDYYQQKYSNESPYYNDNIKEQTKMSEFNSAKMEYLKNRGINHNLFAEYLTVSGLVLNHDIKWISFQGSYDFGYLLKLLLGTELPESEQDFMELLNLYFLNFYDIRMLVKGYQNMQGGLNRLAEQLNVQRLGMMHQAGSDSMITSDVFFKLIQGGYINENKLKDFNNILHGIGAGRDNDETINYTQIANSNYQNSNNNNIMNVNMAPINTSFWNVNLNYYNYPIMMNGQNP